MEVRRVKHAALQGDDADALGLSSDPHGQLMGSDMSSQVRGLLIRFYMGMNPRVSRNL